MAFLATSPALMSGDTPVCLGNRHCGSLSLRDSAPPGNLQLAKTTEEDVSGIRRLAVKQGVAPAPGGGPGMSIFGFRLFGAICAARVRYWGSPLVSLYLTLKFGWMPNGKRKSHGRFPYVAETDHMVGCRFYLDLHDCCLRVLQPS